MTHIRIRASLGGNIPRMSKILPVPRDASVFQNNTRYFEVPSRIVHHALVSAVGPIWRQLHYRILIFAKLTIIPCTFARAGQRQRISPAWVGLVRSGFLRLQPNLDLIGDGLGAGRLIVLALGPLVRLKRRRGSHRKRNRRRLAAHARRLRR